MKTYTKEEVIKLIDKAFWEGTEEDKEEAGECWSAEDFLEEFGGQK